jgi:hypothetical protein
LKFKDDVMFSFEEDFNKLTIFRSEGAKLVVISGALAQFFSNKENQAEADFNEYKMKFKQRFSGYETIEVDRLFEKIKKTLIEHNLIA